MKRTITLTDEQIGLLRCALDEDIRSLKKEMKEQKGAHGGGPNRTTTYIDHLYSELIKKLEECDSLLSLAE